jgi:hypothetical protein
MREGDDMPTLKELAETFVTWQIIANAPIVLAFIR